MTRDEACAEALTILRNDIVNHENRLKAKRAGLPDECAGPEVRALVCSVLRDAEDKWSIRRASSVYQAFRESLDNLDKF